MKLFNLPTVNCGTLLQDTVEKENQIAFERVFTFMFIDTSHPVHVLPELHIIS